MAGYLLLLWTMTAPFPPPTMQRFDTRQQCEAIFETINHLQGLSGLRHECLPIPDPN